MANAAKLLDDHPALGAAPDDPGGADGTKIVLDLPGRAAEARYGELSPAGSAGTTRLELPF